MRLGDSAFLDEIDRMDGLDFERLLKELFERLGYSAELTGRYDHGADLVLEKDGVRFAVQAKRAAREVPRRAVADAVASLAMYGCDRAMVVTNSSFTKPATQLGRANKVFLWDRGRLERELTGFCCVCQKRVSGKIRKWCVDRQGEFRGRVYCWDHQRGLDGVLRVA